jgi:hypothetical protein
MNFKDWFLTEDSNFRRLINLLKQSGFAYIEPGKGDHQMWIKDGYKVSVDPGNVRNPESMFKQYYKQWERNKDFKQDQMNKRNVA